MKDYCDEKKKKVDGYKLYDFNIFRKKKKRMRSSILCMHNYEARSVVEPP